jgi:hypothetical protein
MATNLPGIEAGFCEMWQPVHDRYRLYFEAADTLQQVVADMMRQPIEGGQWPHIAARMTFLAANSMGAVFTLVLNGYGADAMKLARGIYETDINLQWLTKHPDDFQDFMAYSAIQQKQMYDELDEEQQKDVSKEECDQMIADYQAVLGRFPPRNKNAEYRYEWCSSPFAQRAKEAEKNWRAAMEAQSLEIKAKGSLYTNFYRHACSLHHGDIAGLIYQMDKEMNVQLAPSWDWLEDALYNGLGSTVRCLGYLDEIANLGFKARLESGINQDYFTAVKNTK